jgi:DNA-binding NarL/FixJ family response regulator
MNPYRILLADDHNLFREGVKKILENSPGLELVGEAGDGLELMAFLRHSLPDLVILDISMPHLDGLKALKEIKNTYPEVKVLMLTMHDSRGQLLLAFSSGADGYLLKGNTFDDLISAIGTIREGGHFISSLMSKEIIGLFCQKAGHPSANTALNQRELSVLELICMGETDKQIAERLSLSPATIHNHRASLKKKLNIGTTAGLIKYALENGITSNEYN